MQVWTLNSGHPTWGSRTYDSSAESDDASGPYEEVDLEVDLEDNSDELEWDPYFWKLCPYGDSWTDVDIFLITKVFDWKYAWFAYFKKHKDAFQKVLSN